MRGIRLKNFRSFEDTGWIDLRPITVLVGANSSGKSSFLRFFPLLRQTYEEAPTSPLLWYGRYVDFGDFAGALRRGAEPREIGIEFEYEHYAKEYFPLRVVLRVGEIEAKTRTLACSISRDGVCVELLLGNADQPGRCVTRVASNVIGVYELPQERDGWRPGLIPVWRPGHADSAFSVQHYWINALAKEVEEISQGEIVGDAAELVGIFVCSGNGYRGVELANHEPEQLASLFGMSGAALTQKIRGNPAAFQRLRAYALGAQLWLLLNNMWADLGNESEGTIYMGPFRDSPARFYRSQELPVAHMLPTGENLAMFLRSLTAEELEHFSAFVNHYFGYHTRLHVEGSHVSILLEDESGASFNLIDMGYGFSQVLPIIAQCWATASGRRTSKRDPLPGILAFEQPELHLHPFYQALLGDMFVGVINSVRAARTEESQPIRLLVETHSEALVNRLGELIEEGKLATEDVSVLLFEKDPKTGISTIRQSTFAPDGTLTNWPIGFFAP